ncbi:porin [Nitrosophilus kaiyonis]|uniref:porin n=1 Tax=Nitrosophilus kaiyonis TaxID=2930200 RepID=UPI0024907722|nr:porin [Nitrosophilus kaiyonis]
MKLTKLSLAAIMALGFTSAAMADVDVQFGGQAVLYYQTHDYDYKDAPDMFNKEVSQGNVGLQIASKADLGNDFQAGVTVNIIGTLGLEGNLVSGVMQRATDTNDDLDGFWIPEAYVAKTFGNTTLKLGRQYLNTPFAFSETWNVFKNSYEAAVLVNKDLPDTTVVLAMVNKANYNAPGAPMDVFMSFNEDMSTFHDDASVYALGVVNNSIENLNLNVWAYNVTGDANAYWADLSYKLNAGDFPLTVALQGAIIDITNDELKDAADAGGYDDKTNAWGAKIATNIQDWGLSVAYDSVNDGYISMFNAGGVKTKLFVQQTLNQNAIRQDADTWQIKVKTPKFYGVNLTAAYSMTDAGKKNLNKDYNGKGNDFNELDLIASTKVSGIDLQVKYVMQDYDKDAIIKGQKDSKDDNVFRVVARYRF